MMYKSYRYEYRLSPYYEKTLIAERKEIRRKNRHKHKQELRLFDIEK